MRFENLRFRTRLVIVGAIFAAGLAGLLLLETRTLARVMVNGDLYGDVVETKDLIADILPPPMFIEEAYLLALQAAEEPNLMDRKSYLARLRRAGQDYEARHAHWSERLPPGRLRRALLETAAEPVREFFRVAEEQLIPRAEEASAAPEDLRALVHGRLGPLFVRHRGANLETLGIAQEQVAAVEERARREVRDGKLVAALVGVGMALLIAGLGWWVLRSIPRSADLLVSRMRDLAESDGDLARRIDIDSRDEMGDLARSVNRFIEKTASLVKAVRKSSIQLTSTANQVAATSRQQQEAVTSFGASTNEVAAAVQEINATGAELLRTMDEIGGIARASAGLAGAGRTSLVGMGTTMRQLEESSTSVSGRLSEINERAGEITSVVTTITKVADQTNLLSVNAAIEAEKAGEYGRGFHVVAQEIRRLADQTAGATSDIERTVQQMQGAVSSGVMEMDKFSDRVRRTVHDVTEVSGKLAEIISQVEVLTSRFTSVGEGMATQTRGADQISEAMRSLAENVQQTMGSLGEFTSAAEDMRNAAGLLKDEISRFRLDD